MPRQIIVLRTFWADSAWPLRRRRFWSSRRGFIACGRGHQKNQAASTTINAADHAAATASAAASNHISASAAAPVPIACTALTTRASSCACAVLAASTACTQALLASGSLTIDAAAA